MAVVIASLGCLLGFCGCSLLASALAAKSPVFTAVRVYHTSPGLFQCAVRHNFARGRCDDRVDLTKLGVFVVAYDGLRMLKTLIFGFLLGIVGTVAAAYYVPVVDQYRESSLISVAPNGGNTESFRINIPTDRIMIGAPMQAEPLPPGLRWPSEELFDGVRVELFKVRNTRESVIGVASRTVAESEQIEDSVEWVLHLPARGTFYVTMPAQPTDGVSRVGSLRAGTREFRPMQGALSERWVPNTEDEGPDAPDGHIELATSFVGTFSDDVTETALTEGAL